MFDPIELSQVWIANWATGLMAILPLSYAFGAGVVSTVNPCGFAMLPAYLSIYLGTNEEGHTQLSLLSRVGQAFFVGVSVTVGFVVLFGVIGAGIAVGGQFLMSFMPWVGLLTGVVLLIIGGFQLAGKNAYFRQITVLAGRVNTPKVGGFRTFFLFGIGYALASLACTLPVFLVVVGSSVAAKGIFAGFLQFIIYGVGMGVVLVFLTLGIALFKQATVNFFHRVVPYVQRLSAGLVLLMGTYLVYYWLFKTDLIDYPF
jgi:cytochrome c-type biogenesis protein